jgi:hypothetical protein
MGNDVVELSSDEDQLKQALKTLLVSHFEMLSHLS